MPRGDYRFEVSLHCVRCYAPITRSPQLELWEPATHCAACMGVRLDQALAAARAESTAALDLSLARTVGVGPRERTSRRRQRVVTVRDARLT